MSPTNVLILDNGASTIKAGYSGDTSPKQIPNCIVKAKTERKRVYIGDQIDECKDRSSLFYLPPFQRGLIVNWDVEHQIWDHIFGKQCLAISPTQTSLIVTEPYFNFTSIKDTTDEIVFEDYGFSSALRITAGSLCALHYLNEHADQHCCVIVDAGYSFTHIAPYCRGKLIKEGVIRINVGGKVLTNQLKEWISYRQLDVLEESCVMNECKEDSCFVTANFDRDMAIARLKGKRNTILREYVLPDFVNIDRGYLRRPGESKGTEQQFLKLNHERFAIPEMLFRPSDVGINEMGIPEAIVYSIMEKCPEPIRARLFNNIYLVGGNTLFDGYARRIESDVRTLAPDIYDCRVVTAANPINDAWMSGAALIANGQLATQFVSKAEYDEKGQSRICNQRFDQ